MEKWITRGVAALCAAGSAALFWTFGMFLAVPLREGRLLALDRIELQVIGVPLLTGIAVGWGALHLLGLADREKGNAENPGNAGPENANVSTAPHKGRQLIYAAALLTMALAAAFGGMSWTQARIA